MTAPRERQVGSVRFDEYYKVQTYRAGAWVDIQRRFTDIDEAEATFPPGVRSRIMAIDMNGRRPLPETATLTAHDGTETKEETMTAPTIENAESEATPRADAAQKFEAAAGDTFIGKQKDMEHKARVLNDGTAQIMCFAEHGHTKEIAKTIESAHKICFDQYTPRLWYNERLGNNLPEPKAPRPKADAPADKPAKAPHVKKVKATADPEDAVDPTEPTVEEVMTEPETAAAGPTDLFGDE